MRTKKDGKFLILRISADKVKTAQQSMSLPSIRYAIYLCTGCFLIGIGSYQLSRPKLNQISPLHALNPNVAVVTCATAGVSHAFDFSTNVCTGQKWKGFGWKMKQLLRYIKTQDRNALFVLVDGVDTFVNRGAFTFDFHAKWKSFNADIVVASEEACYAADDCYNDMIFSLYKNLSRSKSPFVNSPLAGRGKRSLFFFF